MFAPDTVLTRREPFKAPKGDDPDLRPYNELRVVGPSPVQRNVRSEEWSGQAGDELVVAPLAGFAATVDRPYGELQRDYEVTSAPDPYAPEPVVAPARRVPTPASPEEQFRTGTATPVVARPESEDELRERSLIERIEALEAAAAA